MGNIGIQMGVPQPQPLTEEEKTERDLHRLYDRLDLERETTRLYTTAHEAGRAEARLHIHEARNDLTKLLWGAGTPEERAEWVRRAREELRIARALTHAMVEETARGMRQELDGIERMLDEQEPDAVEVVVDAERAAEQVA